MLLRDISMFSSEEASTQNRCEKLSRNKSSVIYHGKKGTLLVRCFLYKLETNLSLSNPSHSPKKTRLSQQPASNLMDKYPLKIIKDILPSSKDWTGVRHLSYRDHSTSIHRENILCVHRISTKITGTTTSKTYKNSTSDEDILGIHRT